jgi:hypothetical protein
MRLPFLRTVAIACALACAAGASLPLATANRFVRADDRNRDGRPDIWRVYDAHDQLVRNSIDGNLDGRPDESEFYVAGVLVRRELDRNFDHRADLIEQFDPTSGRLAREVVDVDFDGTADLLVLFQAGRPVFEKRADLTSISHPPASAVPETSGNWNPAPTVAFAPLADPFLADTAFHAGSAPSAGDLTIGGPVPAAPVIRCPDIPAAARQAHPVLSVTEPASAPLDPRSPRGPPSIALA